MTLTVDPTITLTGALEEALNNTTQKAPISDSQTWVPMSVTDLLEQPKRAPFLLPSFINYDETRWILVDIDKLTDVSKLEDFLERLFLDKRLLTGINYSVISNILYNFDERIEPYRETFKKQWKPMQLRIASGVADFPVERQCLYQAPTMGRITYPDGQCLYAATFVFAPFKPLPSDTTIPAGPTIDEFIGYMWQYGIHYGFKIDAIKSAIKSMTESWKKGKPIIIAEWLPTERGKNASIKLLAEDTKIDRGATWIGELMNLKGQKRGLPEILKDVAMFCIHPHIWGKDGWSIQWNPIEQPKIQIIIPEETIGEGVRLETDSKTGETIIYSDISGFPDYDAENPLTKPIQVLDLKEMEHGIGPWAEMSETN